MRGLARFILAGRVNAVFVTGFFGAMSLFVLPLAVFSGAAIALVALRKGIGEALYVAVVSGLLIIVSFLLSPTKPGFPFPVVFAVWIPVFVGARVLARFASQTLAILAIGGVCAIFVVGMYLAVGDVVLWWNQWIAAALPAVQDSANAEFGPDSYIRLVNGFVAMLLGFSAMFTLLFARWMQAALFNPGGFSSEFLAIKFPRSVLIGVLVMLVVSSAVNGQMMTDLFMVSLMIYFFGGLAVLHGIVVRRRLNKNWLVAPYVGMLFLPQILIPGLALLGVADSIVDFRSRKIK